MEMAVLSAVSEMFIATSPRNRCENRLAEMPPGEAASSMSPMAQVAGSENARQIP
jgi:hypothetical protein